LYALWLWLARFFDRRPGRGCGSGRPYFRGVVKWMSEGQAIETPRKRREFDRGDCASREGGEGTEASFSPRGSRTSPRRGAAARGSAHGPLADDSPSRRRKENWKRPSGRLPVPPPPRPAQGDGSLIRADRTRKTMPRRSCSPMGGRPAGEDHRPRSRRLRFLRWERAGDDSCCADLHAKGQPGATPGRKMGRTAAGTPYAPPSAPGRLRARRWGNLCAPKKTRSTPHQLPAVGDSRWSAVRKPTAPSELRPVVTRIDGPGASRRTCSAPPPASVRSSPPSRPGRGYGPGALLSRGKCGGRLGGALDYGPWPLESGPGGPRRDRRDLELHESMVVDAVRSAA